MERRTFLCILLLVVSSSSGQETPSPQITDGFLSSADFQDPKFIESSPQHGRQLSDTIIPVDCSISADAFQTAIEGLANNDASVKKIRVSPTAPCNLVLADASTPLNPQFVDNLEITCWDSSLDTPAACTGSTKAVIQAVDSVGASTTYEVGIEFKHCSSITVSGLSVKNFGIKHTANTKNTYVTDSTYTGNHFEGAPQECLKFSWWQSAAFPKAFERITVTHNTFTGFGNHGFVVVSWPTDGDLPENKETYWYSKDIIITDNHFYDVWTDATPTDEASQMSAAGVVLNRCKNVDARKNTFIRMAGSGFWMTQTEDLVFAQNFVAFSRRKADACGNHVDIQADWMIFEHNISYYNEGGFFESMGFSDNNIMRYSISVDDGIEDLRDLQRANKANTIFLTGYTAHYGQVAPTNINIHNNLVVSTNGNEQGWTIQDHPSGIEVTNNEWIVGDGTIALLKDPSKYTISETTAYSNLVGGSAEQVTNFDNMFTVTGTATLAAEPSKTYAQALSDVITNYLDGKDGSQLDFDELKALICALSEPVDVTTVKDTMTPHTLNYPMYVDAVYPHDGLTAQTKDFCDKTITSEFIGAIQTCPAAHNCATCNGTTANDCLTCPYNYERSDTNSTASTCVCHSDYWDAVASTCGAQKAGCTVIPSDKWVESDAAGCVWNSDQLVTPTDGCLQYMYPYCCDNLSECSGISSLDLNTECANMNPLPTNAQFSDNTISVVVTMSAAVVWDPIKTEQDNNGQNWALATTIFSKVMKKQVDNQGVVTYAEQAFAEDMRCSSNVAQTELSCEFQVGSDNTYESTLTDGDKLVIAAGKYTAVSQYDNNASTEQEIEVQAPSSPATIVPGLSYSSTQGKCESTVIDASAATTGGTCKLTYAWQATLSKTSSSSTRNQDEMGLVIDGVRLTLTSDQYSDYDTISGQVTISRCYGTSATETFTITLSDKPAIPTVVPISTITKKQKQNVNFTIRASARTSCGNKVNTFYYKFDQVQSNKNTLEIADGYWSNIVYWTNQRTLRIPKKTLDAGRTYQFNIQVASYNNAADADYASQVVQVVVLPEELDVSIDGGDRTQNVNQDLTLSSGAATGRRLQTSYSCSWTCEDWTNKGQNPLYSSSITSDEIANLDAALKSDLQGFNAASCTNQQGSALMDTLNNSIDSDLLIPAGSMPDGKLYYFKSTCNLSGANYSGYSWIQTITASTNGTISIAPKVIKPNWNNKLTATFTSDYANSSVQWELVDTVAGFSFASVTDKPTVSFKSDALQVNTPYTFKATLVEINQTTEVFAELQTIIESPPYGGTFVVSTDSGSLSGTKDTEWTMTFSNWVTADTSDMSYKVYLRTTDASGQSITVAGTSSEVDTFTVQFPCSRTQTQFTVYGSVQNETSGSVDTSEQAITIATCTVEDQGVAATAFKTEYEMPTTAQSTSEKIQLLGQILSMSQSHSVATKSFAIDEMTKLPFDSMTISEAEQVASAIAQSTSVTGTDAENVKAALNSLITHVQDEVTVSDGDVLPTQLLIDNTIIALGLLPNDRTSNSGRRLSDVEDLQDQISALALQDAGVGVCQDLSSCNLNLKACVYEKSDITQQVTTPGCSSRRLTTSSNPGTVTIPSCIMPNTADNEFIVKAATSGDLNEQLEDGQTQTANTLAVVISDRSGNQIQEESCADNIEVCLSYVNSLSVPDGETSWVYTSTWLTDQVFTCRYWNDGDWSTEGIDNTQTTVDFTTGTVCCYSTHAGTFVATLDRVNTESSTEVTSSTDISNITIRSSDGDDDWEYMENINALYIGIGGIFLMIIFILTFITFDKKTITVQAESEAESPQTDFSGMQDKSIHNYSLARSTQTQPTLSTPKQAQPDSLTVHPLATPDLPHLDPNNTLEPSSDSTIIAQESNLCMFVVKNSFIGELITTSGMTRAARIAIFFTNLQVVIMECVGGLELGLEWYIAGCMAAACSVIVELLLAVLIEPCVCGKPTLKRVVLGIILLIINTGSIIFQVLVASNRGETFNNDWMLAICVGYTIFFSIGKQICSIAKYALLRLSQA